MLTTNTITKHYSQAVITLEETHFYVLDVVLDLTPDLCEFLHWQIVDKVIFLSFMLRKFKKRSIQPNLTTPVHFIHTCNTTHSACLVKNLIISTIT